MLDPTLMIVMQQPGGVTDYAQVVAERMGAQVQVLPFDQDLPLDGSAVLLHYSGYGYAKRGAPVHLLGWLRRNRPRMRRFGVYFHELYAMGKPTSSAFWLSPLQRYVASRLARASDFWMTNIEESDGWLLRRAGDVPHRRLAVCSNIGELTACETVNREPVAVVFGGAALRTLTYRAGGAALFGWARQHGIELHDIGPPVEDAEVAKALRDHGAVAHGRLAPEAIQARMATARFGVTRYPPRFVAKSGVFNAYCAHGLVPILLTDSHGAFDGLSPGAQYLDGIPAKAIGADEGSRVARSAFDWYQGHRVDAHAQAMTELLAAR